MEKTDSRIAVIGIIIEDREKAEQVNSLLHQYGEYIIGRMGIPYREKQVNIISVVLDAPAGCYQRPGRKAGKTSGSQFKAIYSREKTNRKETE